jgi:CHRD domain
MKRRFILAAGVVAAATIGAVSLSSGQPSTPQDKALFGVMTGKKEVDAEGNRRVGDPDGRGSFTAIIVDGTQFCYGITVDNIAPPMAAHIHIGRPNQAGPIVLPLDTIPTPSGDPGVSSDCIDIPTEPEGLAQAILKNPHKYYVNVHTAAFPDGAVRNQLFSRR